jgi:hypothetical protein
MHGGLYAVCWIKLSREKRVTRDFAEGTDITDITEARIVAGLGEVPSEGLLTPCVRMIRQRV